MSSQSVSM